MGVRFALFVCRRSRARIGFAIERISATVLSAMQIVAPVGVPTSVAKAQITIDEALAAVDRALGGC
jgi:hypothetical protein